MSFFIEKKISLNLVLDISGQTKIRHSYGGGESITKYITDIFIFTLKQDYQIKVFERAKLDEFKSKFMEAKSVKAKTKAKPLF